jgi:hypothetical protein
MLGEVVKVGAPKRRGAGLPRASKRTRTPLQKGFKFKKFKMDRIEI